MAVYNIIQRSTIKEGNNILAEHYQKERMENENLLKKVSSYKIKHYFKESTETINPVLLNSDWRVFDLTDSISQFLIGGINPEEVEVSSNKKIAQPSSFIISRLRHYLKEMAIVPTISEKIALSTEYLVFKSKSDVTPHLLLVFSLTKYVQTILDWAQTGNAHPRFSSITFKNIYLPDILVERSNIYQSVIDESIDLLNKSRETYNQAAELLAKALGLNDIQFKNEKSYTASFSEIVGGSNTSSYFYQPKYTKLDRLINKFENVKLRSLIKEFSTGFAFTKEQLQKDENSSLLLKIGNLKEMDIDLSSTDYVNKKGEIAGSNEKVNIGNILIGMSGSVGVASVIRENINAFVNQRILRLDVEDTIDPEYLALVINSLVGKLQFEKYATGGVQLNISPRDILRFSIPRLGKIEEEISQLSLKSYRYKQLSKYLLEQAIQEVESLIEKAAERL